MSRTTWLAGLLLLAGAGPAFADTAEEAQKETARDLGGRESGTRRQTGG